MTTRTAVRSRVLYAASAGVLTLYPLGRAPRWVTTGWVVLPTAFTGVATAVVARGQERPARTRLTMVTGLSALMAAGQGFSLVVDRTVEAWLSSRVRRPRVVMALGVAALTAVTTHGEGVTPPGSLA